MSQPGRTALFAAVAAASVAIAIGMHASNRPVDLKDFSDVGSEFYPSFTDPNSATGLRVASYNSDSGKTDVFSVENKDGLWIIPSHHGYPADGQERLAKTAASMIGVRRLALVDPSSAAQKRYGLLDPLNRDVAGTEGRGDRVTLFQGDQPIVDFIVGKKVDGEQNVYYVRRADENRVYTADLGNLSLSTKFSDWIQKDVLDVNRSAIREIVINRYQVDEARGRVVSEGQIELKRPSSTGDWSMEGLKDETEKVKTVEVNNLLSALDDLQIVGVRPKPPGLSAGLKSDGPISIDPLTEHDLAQKGYFIVKGRFISNEGEVNVGTDEGVFYTLGFGEEFSGSDVDIEVGKAKTADAATKEENKKDVEAAEAQDEPGDETAASDAKEDSSTPAKEEEGDKAEEETPPSDKAEKDDPSQKKSRYLFVTVQFDKQLLGPPPEAPVKPEPPAKDSDEEKKEEAPAENPADTEKPADAATPEDPQKAYEAALARYEEEKSVYETKLKDYEEKVKKGQERVANLSARFADWYYVISEDVFDRLKLKREDLVEKKEPPKEEEKGDAEASATSPDAAPPTPPADGESSEKPAGEESNKTDAEPNKESASESPAGDEKAAEEKPAAETPETE